ncbi:YqaA family protein [Acidobacteriota bacterium]
MPTGKTKWILFVSSLTLAVSAGYLILSGGRFTQILGYVAYMSVACTLVPLPTPPVVIKMGKAFHPGTVAIAGALANCLAAAVEYRLLSWLMVRARLKQRTEAHRSFRRFARYFKRYAFLCLAVSGFTPIPFEPFRIAAILANYSFPKYLLAVFAGRLPRYFLVAQIGYLFSVPPYLLVVLFAVLLLIPLVGAYGGGRPPRRLPF